MPVPERPTDWLRGPLDLCVLGLLRDGPTYGYRLAAALEEGGLGQIKGGTLYPLLARLERDGLVRTEWRAGDGGPGRKFYELTEYGRGRLESLARLWRQFAGVVDALLPAPAELEELA
jgi:PadR family transcriptional regulator PadR